MGLWAAPSGLGAARPSTVIHFTPSNSVPFDASMIEPIMKTIATCPIGPNALRVFQQHRGLGLCWNDAMFMLLFESDVFKPVLHPIIRRMLELNAEQGNLNFGNVGESEPKLHAIATTLRTEFSPTLRLAVWEFLTLNLQRYIQLVHMFVTDPSVRETLPNANIKTSRLLNRRKSLQHENFSKIHLFVKPAVMCGKDSYGAEDITKLISYLNDFLETNLEGAYKFVAKSPEDPTTILGYYFEKFYHIISLFKCGGIWFLFDNELGCLPFAEEDSEKINTIGIKNFGKEFKAGYCTYTFILNNDEPITIQFVNNIEPPFSLRPINPKFKILEGVEIIEKNEINVEGNPYKQRYYKIYKTFPATDYLGHKTRYLVKKPAGGAAVTPAPAAPAALGPIASGNGTPRPAGGRRKQRKTRRKQRHARKKTRAHK
jgi:hypothetical protein